MIKAGSYEIKFSSVRLRMSRAIRHRHVMEFCLKRTPFDSYRFSDTSMEPLTRHICELRAHTHSRTSVCMRKMDKHSHRHAGVSPRQADIAWSWASISLEQRWTTRDLPIRDNAITVNSAKDDANDHDMTFMCRRTYIEWRCYIVRNKYYLWHQDQIIPQRRVKGLYVYFDDSTTDILLFPLSRDILILTFWNFIFVDSLYTGHITVI